jgi:hypothetical protein
MYLPLFHFFEDLLESGLWAQSRFEVKALG